MIKVFLNNVDISNKTEIDFSYVEKLNIELDEGFINISHTTDKDPYPMFSVIDIFEDETLLFSGRISQDNVSLSSFDSQIYNHAVTIIEHTKLLEKFIITGKTFTQPLDTSLAPLYTLYDVIDILRKTTNFEILGQEQVNIPFNISLELQQETENIISPEFTFKDVNLREALNEVMYYLGGVARLKKNGDLVVERFSELKNEIELVTENYKKNQDIQNYATTLSSDLLNPVNTSVGFGEYNGEWYPGIDLWTTPRSDSLTQFDFEQSFIPTPKPIYDLKQVLTSIDVVVIEDASSIGGGINEVVNDDNYLLNLQTSIVEKSIYDALEDSFTTNFLAKTKRNTLYYNYGSPNIFIGETFGLFDISTSYRKAVERSLVIQLVDENIIPQSYADYLESEPGSQPLPDVLYSFTINFPNENDFLKRWTHLFRVNYIPLAPSIRYEVERDDISEISINTKSIVNQKLRIIDLERFTNNMKGRVNQLGSSELILSHKVSSINDSYNVGDFTVDKFVITKKEVIGQRDHYIINYELNKNFNRLSPFVGIDQEIRQYEIGEKGRSLDRDLVYSEYFEVYSTDGNEVNTSNNMQTLSQPKVLLNMFDGITANLFMKHAVVTSSDLVDDEDNEIPLLLPIYKLSGGNAFGFYIDFVNNASAGDQLLPGEETGWFNFNEFRRYNLPFKYTDQIGRLDDLRIRMYRQGFIEGSFDDEVFHGNNLPVLTRTITQSFTDIDGEFYVKKDNRERLKITMLYHVLSKNVNDIVIGQKLLSHNPFLSEEAFDVNLRIFTTNKIFNINDSNLKITNQDTLLESPNITISVDNGYIEINEDLSNAKAWAITDGDGYPLIMVNSNNKRVVFEFNNKRSGVTYKLFEPQLRVSIEETINITDEVTASTFFSKVAPPLTETMTLSVSPIIYQANEFEFVTVPPFTDQIALNVLPLDASATYQPLTAPNVTFSSITENTANMSVSNSNNIPVVFYYRRISPSVTSYQSVGILDNDSANISLSGLSGGTNYVYESYFESASNSNVISPTVQDNFTTTAVPTYDITFNPNGGTWADGSTTNKVVADKEQGDIISSAPLGISRSGYNFLGWNPSLPYTVGTSDDTLFAQWQLQTPYVVRARTASSDYNVEVQIETPNVQFQGILNSSYQVIDNNIDSNSTYSLSLNAPITISQGGNSYSFVSWKLNGQTVSQNREVTLNNLSGDSDLEITYVLAPTFPS